MNTAEAIDKSVSENGKRVIEIGLNKITILVEAENTGGTFSMIEYVVAPLFQAPPTLHFHTKEFCTAYVVEGSIGIQIGEETTINNAGSVFQFVKDAPFRWWNAEDKPSKFLAIYTPAGFENYFVELNETIKDRPEGPLDMKALMPKIIPLWGKYGMGVFK